MHDRHSCPRGRIGDGGDAHLTDEFLEDVARQYVIIGRGYSNALAERYQVTPRTVVGWIEKARARGILSSTSSGRAGGEVVARSKR